MGEENNNSGYYKEYLFKSQAKGRGLDVGPFTLIEGYSTKTDITVDSDYLNYSQSRFFGKNKRDQIKIDEIKTIESGAYFSVWFLVFIAFTAGVCALTPILVGTSPAVRLIGIVAVVAFSIFEVKNIRVTIMYPRGKVFFDSTDKENIKQFENDMKIHPKYTGEIKKSRFLIQKIVIIGSLILAIVMVVNPNPFAGSLLFEGTYQEWEEANYPGNYRTYIIADVTVGMNDTENDSIAVAAGDNFDKEIWITNNKGQKIRDWKWLHEAMPVEGNLAIFEITLTCFGDDEFTDDDKYFVYEDPVAVSYDEYMTKVGAE